MEDGIKDPRAQAWPQRVWCAGLYRTHARGDGSHSGRWGVAREAAGWHESGEDVGDLQEQGGVRHDGRLPAKATMWICSVTLRSKTRFLLGVWLV